MTEPTVVPESAVVVVAPTVGRALHYYPTHKEANSDAIFAMHKPHAATVAYVYPPSGGEDFCRVNVCVLDASGHAYSRTNVPLVASEARPAEGSYVVWPPR